ncbi:MAG: ABC transporter substrate-binding protein [Phycisphaerae bacterium]|nr:ABC transporter substrate-binding protein [Gemmatimonadaceae bacterium]
MTQIRQLLLLFASSSAVACGALSSDVDKSSAEVSTNAGTFAIGVGANPEKTNYQGVTRGLQLAIERLNDDSTARATRFSLRAPDAGASSAVQIAQQLRDDPSVIAVVGHPESGTSLEAIPVYADEEHANADAVVAISPTASSPRLSGASAWFFRVAPSDNETARLVAAYVADSLKAKTVAVIYRNDSYGRDWSARFAETFTARNGSILAKVPYLTKITEWDAYALQLKALAPEVLLFPGDADDATAMLRALKKHDVNLTFVGGDATAGIARSHEFPEAKYTAFFVPERATSAEGKRFVESYRARYNEEPDMYAALSYDAAIAIGRTVIAGARNRKALRDALEKMNGTMSLEGAGGRIAFDARHDITGRTIVIATVGSAPRGAAK